MATTADGGGKEINLDIEMDEGEPLGAVPNDKLIIIKIQAGTLAEGKLKIGDQILRVNGRATEDLAHFFKQLRYAPPCATLTILRDSKKADELQQRCHIPPEREKNINKRDGYEYLITKLVWKPGGQKLGLGIKHYQNRVLVSRTDAGSLAAACLLLGDQIIDLGGIPVTDKDVARDLLLKNLKATGEVSILVGRPETMEAKHWTHSALTISSQENQPPSVQMNEDVIAILQRERANLKAKAGKQLKSILRQPKAEKKENSVFINEQSHSNIIASDNEGKQLRGVRK